MILTEHVIIANPKTGNVQQRRKHKSKIRGTMHIKKVIILQQKQKNNILLKHGSD